MVVFGSKIGGTSLGVARAQLQDAGANERHQEELPDLLSVLTAHVRAMWAIGHAHDWRHIAAKEDEGRHDVCRQPAHTYTHGSSETHKT